MTEEPATGSATYVHVDAAVERLPGWLQRPVAWGLSRWPGRIFLATTASFIKLEIFDRSMSIAAQFFTSVFPIVIMLATWFGGNDSRLVSSLGLPGETEQLLDEAMAGQSATAFGVVGVVVVIASATSLSRALTRAFAAIWDLPRPHIKVVNAWRWVAVVMTLVLALVFVRAFTRATDDLPPPGFWQITASLVFDVGVTVFVTWILLAGAIRVRRLLPGAALFGLVMLFIRPVSTHWLPQYLDSSADRYGSFGVAFTYLAWLYVISFAFLAANGIGAVIGNDNGTVGTWIRGRPVADEAVPELGSSNGAP